MYAYVDVMYILYSYTPPRGFGRFEMGCAKNLKVTRQDSELPGRGLVPSTSVESGPVTFWKGHLECLVRAHRGPVSRQGPKGKFDARTGWERAPSSGQASGYPSPQSTTSPPASTTKKQTHQARFPSTVLAFRPPTLNPDTSPAFPSHRNRRPLLRFGIEGPNAPARTRCCRCLSPLRTRSIGHHPHPTSADPKPSLLPCRH